MNPSRQKRFPSLDCSESPVDEAAQRYRTTALEHAADATVSPSPVSSFYKKPTLSPAARGEDDIVWAAKESGASNPILLPHFGQQVGFQPEEKA